MRGCGLLEMTSDSPSMLWWPRCGANAASFSEISRRLGDDLQVPSGYPAAPCGHSARIQPCTKRLILGNTSFSKPSKQDRLRTFRENILHMFVTSQSCALLEDAIAASCETPSICWFWRTPSPKAEQQALEGDRIGTGIEG